LLAHYVNKSFNRQGGQIQDNENQEYSNQEEEFDYGNIDYEDFEVENQCLEMIAIMKMELTKKKRKLMFLV
jgi:hypothetical protein